MVSVECLVWLQLKLHCECNDVFCDSLNIRLSSDVDVEADALVDVDVDV